MTGKVVLPSLVASFGSCNRGVEDIALLFDAFPRTLKRRASCEATLVLAALLTARLHLRPSGLLRKVLFKQAINQLFKR
jgi:hypothetical protein